MFLREPLYVFINHKDTIRLSFIFIVKPLQKKIYEIHNIVHEEKNTTYVTIRFIYEYHKYKIKCII